MKIAADELKTDKRRWFPTERVIKLQNFLPQEFKESKHYISAEGNYCFVEESSNTLPILVQEILLLQTVGGSRNILGKHCCVSIVFLHAPLLGTISVRIFEWTWTPGSCLVKPLLCFKACPFCVFISLLLVFQNPF